MALAAQSIWLRSVGQAKGLLQFVVVSWFVSLLRSAQRVVAVPEHPDSGFNGVGVNSGVGSPADGRLHATGSS